jgi:hypothetical protein
MRPFRLPGLFHVVKHLTAALFAAIAAGLLVLGLDGVLSAMHKLTRLYVATPPSPAAPADAPAPTPGMMSAFVVPADEAARSMAPATGATETP